ncbi:MAG: DUF2148 domain-containing protein [Candidatus Margulisiibacteriota bacterium]
MLTKYQDFKDSAIERIAQEMCLAARTAPKARGLDLLEMAIIKGETLKQLSDKMKEIGDARNHFTFQRDSQSILSAQIMVLIGTKKQTIGLKYCGFCGFENCAAAEKAGALCAYNSGDLGIALGSAVSVAMDHRLDNRIMYSAGKAAVEMQLLGKDIVAAYGIPLSATAKNPFFDRK